MHIVQGRVQVVALVLLIQALVHFETDISVLGLPGLVAKVGDMAFLDLFYECLLLKCMVQAGKSFLLGAQFGRVNLASREQDTGREETQDG